MSYTNINQVLGNFTQQTLVCHTPHDKTKKDFDSCLLAGMVLVDLQKAFDTTDHNILI